MRLKRRKEHRRAFGGAHDTKPSRGEVPTPGRWIRSGRCTPRGHNHADCRLADLSSLKPHQVAATVPTPDRSTTRRKDHAQAEEGLTLEGPLQKGVQNRLA